MTVSAEIIQHGIVRASSGRERKRILVCTGSYLPGYKSGGPIRSIANLVVHLSPYFDFYVVTRDRDSTDTEHYPGVVPDKWDRVGSARVLYCSSVGFALLRRVVRVVQPDIIYLNSFQDVFTLISVVLRRGGAFGKIPTLLAPRGEFSAGALEIRGRKKALYLRAAKLLGLHEDLHWQVTSLQEKRDLLQAAPARLIDPDSIHLVGNICNAVASTAPHVAKIPGSLKLAFISRMCEQKNLHFLLEVLREVRGAVLLSLFGPVTGKDVAYWKRCNAMLVQLPDNIQVDYRGSLDHPAVPQALHDHHFFVLPTKGENFCHAAVESFVNGTPVILSDETPWLRLAEAKAGFDISLSDRAGWVEALQRCVDMDPQTYALYLEGTAQYGRRFSTEEAALQHRSMFEAALCSNTNHKVRY